MLGIVVWGAILAYVVFAAHRCSEEKNAIRVADVNIRVLDGDVYDLVKEETVAAWLEADGYTLAGAPLTAVNTNEIEDYLESQPFIDDASVWAEIDGTLNIEVTQRSPIMRVRTAQGRDFYVSDDLRILPYRPGSPVYVPLVTGNLALPFDSDFSGSLESLPEAVKKSDQNYLYLLKLITFVRQLTEDPFWDAQIVQIDMDGTGIAVSGNGADAARAPEGTGRNTYWREPEVELVMRVGNHRVLLGTLDDTQEKLGKLMLFYDKVLPNDGWDAYRTINLKYEGQIVCRR